MAKFLIPRRRRWFIVGIIFLAIVFNYFDRQIISILKPELKEAFGIDDGGYAFLANIFLVCYAIMYPVSGWLTDRFGPRLVMLGGIIGWSIACLGGGFSRTFAHFGFFRGMLGAAEPTNFPAQLKVVTIWFPGRLRATANSLCVAGSSIGAILAPPLVAALAIRYGWHAAFIVPGIVGLLIALAWFLIYRDPPPEMAREAVESAGTTVDEAFDWSQLWKTRSLWAILLIRFVSDPVWYFCLFWLPGYLREDSGLTLKQVGMYGWIPFLCADLGGIGTSAWSDWMVRRGMRPLRSRKVMLTTAAVFAPLCAIIPFLPSPTVTIKIFSLATFHVPTVAVTIAIFGVVCAVCISWLFSMSVVIAETFPMKNVASILGIAGGFGAVGGAVFNYYVGQHLDTSGATKIFVIMAMLHPIAVVILWKMVRPEKPNVKLSV